MTPFTGVAKERLGRAFRKADIVINGDAPWDPKIRDPRTYRRVLTQGALGAGESYMDGWWECEALDELAARVLGAGLQRSIGAIWEKTLHTLFARIVNLQSRARAYVVGERHYDIGNDLYRAMLGPSMVYSCADWSRARNLDEAQEAKLEAVCHQLDLRPGQRLLDLGCGWGSLAKHAAEYYRVDVVGLTISREQARFARELCRGLPVEIRLQDYRALDEAFDRVVSIGMFEHVGAHNYATYFDVVCRCLADEGRLVLQTIGSLHSAHANDPWIEKYIFPNSMLPSARQIAEAAEGRVALEEWQNLASYYEKTLLAWWSNFQAAWPKLRTRYGERFRRMWRYYLLTCAGSFRVRHNQLWRLVLSKQGEAPVQRRFGTEPWTAGDLEATWPAVARSA